MASSLRVPCERSIAVVVPSTCDETFGIVAAEAISCGRLVLVSDAGGLPEVVDHTDCVIPAGNEDAWAEALIRVRANPPWRHMMEARLPVIAQRFTEQRYVEEYLALYSTLLSA